MKLFDATIQLTKASLRVLRANRKLALFPILSIVALVCLLVLILPIITGSEQPTWLLLVFLVFAFQFTSMFFELALCSQALRCLHGEIPTIRGGILSASKRLPSLAMYTLITSTVGLVIALIGSSSKAGVRLAKRLVSTAWSLVTYFALPVMAQEKRGGYDSLMRSSKLFRSTWGETTLAEVGFRAFASHLAFIMLIVLAWLVFTFGDSGLVLIIAAGTWLGLMSIFGALEAVYRAAMYIFAAEGVVPEPFDTAELDAVWRTK